MSNLNRSVFQGHPFHLVSPSPWSILICISLLIFIISEVLITHGLSYAGDLLPIIFTLLVSSMFFWFRDVIFEGIYLENHTLAIQRGLNMRVGLFIVSEALFFLTIFWACFHSALSPTVEVGAQWPPMGIEAINAFELPLLNTVILLASGVTITYSHHSLIQGNRNAALNGAMYTTLLALVFTAFQDVEYSVSSFTLSDGAYGSCFYFGTGFHGLHITIGIMFLTLRVLTFVGIPFNWEPLFRFRVRDILLTFCGHDFIFFASVCLSLNLIVDHWVSNLGLIKGSNLVLANGASEATSGEITNKQDELDHARRALERKEQQKESLNNEHSAAGDNHYDDLERKLGNQLEQLASEISDKWEEIKELIEWLAN